MKVIKLNESNPGWPKGAGHAQVLDDLANQFGITRREVKCENCMYFIQTPESNEANGLRAYDRNWGVCTCGSIDVPTTTWENCPEFKVKK